MRDYEATRQLWNAHAAGAGASQVEDRKLPARCRLEWSTSMVHSVARRLLRLEKLAAAQEFLVCVSSVRRNPSPPAKTLTSVLQQASDVGVTVFPHHMARP